MMDLMIMIRNSKYSWTETNFLYVALYVIVLFSILISLFFVVLKSLI